ncbi:MAG: hypothetical protein Ct9H300mP12_01340 [Acidimicrobiales bacterium]|nr:MAG: hypothetical protein Ct9H300mP12_01340 [Acidimicrobiales bacterium]
MGTHKLYAIGRSPKGAMATDASTRSSGGVGVRVSSPPLWSLRPVNSPRNRFPLTPIKTGQPEATNTSTCRTRARLWAAVPFPNPMPGSIQTSDTPAVTAAVGPPRAGSCEPPPPHRRRRARPAWCAGRPALNGHPAHTQVGAATSCKLALTSLTMVAPAATAATATAAGRVSMEIRTDLTATAESVANISMTGITRATSSSSSPVAHQGGSTRHRHRRCGPFGDHGPPRATANA